MNEAYFIAKVALGLNILMHGITRLGPKTAFFQQLLVKDFENTILPPLLVKYFGKTLPVLETVTGVLLLAGFCTPFGIALGSLLLLLLLFGKCLLSDWQTVSLQMIYLAFYAALSAGIHYNDYALDSLFFNH